MKAQHYDETVEFGGVKDQQTLTIKNTSKLFSLMVDSLYQDKYGSVVRELSANGYDEHVSAGIPDTPLKITVPDSIYPEFKIRDFGRGLNSEEILMFFGRLLETTKDDSNEVRGAFGLGCKSPFSVVDSFTVRSIKDGIETICVLARENKGTPTIAVISEKPTTEHSGTEVIIVDENTKEWKKAIATQLSIYPVRPDVSCDIDWININKIGDLSYTQGRINNHRIMVDMGHVLYPVTSLDCDEYLECDDNKQTGTVIYHVGIGDVDIPPDRERLEFTAKTKETLKRVVAKTIESVNKAAVDLANNLEPKNYTTIRQLADSIYIKTNKNNDFIFNQAITSISRNEFFTEADYKLQGLDQHSTINDILNSRPVHQNIVGFTSYRPHYNRLNRDTIFKHSSLSVQNKLYISVNRGILVNEVIRSNAGKKVAILSLNKKADKDLISFYINLANFFGLEYELHIKQTEAKQKRFALTGQQRAAVPTLPAKYKGIYIGPRHMKVDDIPFIETGKYIKVERKTPQSETNVDSMIEAELAKQGLTIVYMTPIKSSQFKRTNIFTYYEAVKKHLCNYNKLIDYKFNNKSMYNTLRRNYNGLVTDTFNQNKAKYVKDMKVRLLSKVETKTLSIRDIEKHVTANQINRHDVYNSLYNLGIINETNIDSILESFVSATL